MEYNAPELRHGTSYLKRPPLTPAIIAAEAATEAAWTMFAQAINDREHKADNFLTLDEIKGLGDDASKCESTCRLMRQELYLKELNNG
jgi:hypothetical protein